MEWYVVYAMGLVMTILYSGYSDTPILAWLSFIWPLVWIVMGFFKLGEYIKKRHEIMKYDKEYKRGRWANK
jgi:hypothetical protein